MIPAELRPLPQFRVLQRRQPPDELPEGPDNVYAAPTAEEVELPRGDLDRIRELLAEVPYRSGMETLSVLSAGDFYARMDADIHRRLAAQFFPEPILRKVLRFLDAGDNRVAFNPRQIATLQRLVILYGADEGHPAQPQAARRRLAEALLMVASLPDGAPADAESKAETAPDTEAWARYLLRIGLYHSRPWIMETLSLTWSLYATVAPDLRHLPESCPIDAWLHEKYGFVLAEQLAIGVAYGMVAGAFDPTLRLRERYERFAKPGVLAETGLAAREADAVTLISADRTELRARLETPDVMRMGWEHSAFEAKPFLRGENGWLIPHSPWALMAWMTRGVHYRVLDAAREHHRAKRKGRNNDWLTHSGALGEEHVRRLIRRSLPTSPLWAERFHGEVTFRGPDGDERSSDAAIERGPDLVLIEVYTGRFAIDVRASDDPEPALDALKRATVTKLSELLNRAEDALLGRFTYPGAAMRPETVWPVLVLAGDSVPLNPLVWGWIRDRLNGTLATHPQISRPVIVGVDDLEPLLVLKEDGNDLVDLLARFLRSDSAEFDLRNWIAREFDLLADHRPAYVRAQWLEAMAALGGVLYPDSTKLEAKLTEIDAQAQRRARLS